MIAHSHGGNVVAEALPTLEAAGGNPRGITGTITTIGTPFIDTLSAITRRVERAKRLSNWIAWAFYAAVLAGWCFVAYLVVGERHDLKEFSIAHGVLFAVLIGLLSLGVYSIIRRKRRGGWKRYWDTLNKASNPAFILAIGSPMDEVWQLLHHVRALENPLRVREGLLGYLYQRWKAYVRRIHDVQRIHGASFWMNLSWLAKIVSLVFYGILGLGIFAAGVTFFGGFSPETGYNPDALSRQEVVGDICEAGTLLFLWLGAISLLTFVFGTSFYSALLSPVRWIFVHTRAIAGLPSEILTYIVRWRAWSLLQELALGIEGYKFRLPVVERTPPFVAEGVYKYEDLTKEAEARALTRRSDWVQRHFGDLSQTFSRMVVTASDLSSLLELIAKESSLFLCAYYAEDVSVKRIADWIATGS